ncbi:unnamed protein product [Peniophora sp. CBMAI 1063]|nr:unnamed protein product [Peniophora sp. CBMAI 1063]
MPAVASHPPKVWDISWHQLLSYPTNWGSICAPRMVDCTMGDLSSRRNTSDASGRQDAIADMVFHVMRLELLAETTDDARRMRYLENVPLRCHIERQSMHEALRDAELASRLPTLGAKGRTIALCKAAMDYIGEALVVRVHAPESEFTIELPDNTQDLEGVLLRIELANIACFLVRSSRTGYSQANESELDAFMWKSLTRADPGRDRITIELDAIARKYGVNRAYLTDIAAHLQYYSNGTVALKNVIGDLLYRAGGPSRLKDETHSKNRGISDGSTRRQASLDAEKAGPDYLVLEIMRRVSWSLHPENNQQFHNCLAFLCR